MFDISWTEFLLIGVVALIVIGPKELPAVMRTIGQWTRKIRTMAADFQRQFERELREAEFADLKKQVDDVEQNIKGYDPLKDVRSDVDAIGKDLETSLEHKAPPPSSENVSAAAEPAASESAAKAAHELPSPQPAAEPREKQIIAAAIASVTPEPVEQAQPADSTRRTG
jgi:sec-independent protein translocase protein TatB